MEKRDYLLKQAEQLGVALGKVLSKLLDLKESKTMTLVSVNQIFAKELDFDVNRLNDTNEEKWLDKLNGERLFNSENMERLADILLFVAENVNSDEKNQLYKKSLEIYKYLDESEKTYSFDRNSKIAKIDASIFAIDY